MTGRSCVIKRSWDAHPDVLRERAVHEINAVEIDVSTLLVKSVHIVLPFRVGICSGDGKMDSFRLGTTSSG
jgi:hypothetical protein